MVRCIYWWPSEDWERPLSPWDREGERERPGSWWDSGVLWDPEVLPENAWLCALLALSVPPPPRAHLQAEGACGRAEAFCLLG